MKLIYSHENMAVVQSVKNLLELNDIKCFLKNEHGISMGSELGHANTFLELWAAHEKDHQKALDLVESQVNNPAEKDAWVCNECQEENEGMFEICWNCQSACV